jgi:hypothetical protein
MSANPTDTFAAGLIGGITVKKLTGLLLVLALAATACGGDDASGEPDLSTCDGVADATIDLVQDVITELEVLSPSDFGRLTQEGTGDFPVFAEIAERGDTLGTAAVDLGCDDIDQLVADRADQLEADPANGFSQLIIDSTRQGEDVLARLFR